MKPLETRSTAPGCCTPGNWTAEWHQLPLKPIFLHCTSIWRSGNAVCHNFFNEINDLGKCLHEEIAQMSFKNNDLRRYVKVMLQISRWSGARCAPDQGLGAGPVILMRDTVSLRLRRAHRGMRPDQGTHPRALRAACRRSIAASRFRECSATDPRCGSVRRDGRRRRRHPPRSCGLATRLPRS